MFNGIGRWMPQIVDERGLSIELKTLFHFFKIKLWY